MSINDVGLVQIVFRIWPVCGPGTAVVLPCVCVCVRVCVIVIFHGRCPDYLSNIVRPVDLSRSRAGLRSSSTTNFTMPQLRTKCGERNFSHAGPAAWNALPEDMRAVSDSVLFRKRLKTHLFMVALCNRADHNIFIL